MHTATTSLYVREADQMLDLNGLLNSVGDPSGSQEPLSNVPVSSRLWYAWSLEPGNNTGAPKGEVNSLTFSLNLRFTIHVNR